jgi:voltage-gated potassium channel
LSWSVVVEGKVMAGEKPIEPRWSEWWQFCGERRFGILLVILVGLLAGSPILFNFGVSAIWFDGLMALVLLAAIQSLCFERRQRLCALLFGIPTVLFCIAGHAFSGTASRSVLFLGHLSGVLFLFGAAVVIVKSLFNSRSLTFDSIFGAVCGYLFLGVAWAMAYSMIETFQPDSFQFSESLRSSGENAQPSVLMYYSFVTLTTVGYGDVTPITSTTRTFAWIEAITGQFYLAIIVAGLVSMLVANTSQPQQQGKPVEQGDLA